MPTSMSSNRSKTLKAEPDELRRWSHARLHHAGVLQESARLRVTALMCDCAVRLVHDCAAPVSSCIHAPGFDACMLEGGDLACSIPLERWDGEALDAPADIIQTNALRFAVLLPSGVAHFDAGAFRLGAAEAAALDPQQRLLLEQAAGALQVRRRIPIVYLRLDDSSIVNGALHSAGQVTINA